MAQTVRSSYYNLPQQYTPELRIPPGGGILEQRFQSTSHSKSVVRFRLNSSAPRALMLNRLRITIPMTLSFSVAVGGSAPVVAAANGLLAAANNQQVYLRGVFERCLESISVEINNSTQITRRGSDLCDLWESLLVSDYDQQFLTLGPQNKPNSKGYFVGRAADYFAGNRAADAGGMANEGASQIAVNAGRYPIYSEKCDELDEGAAKKLDIFREMSGGVAIAANADTKYNFTFDLDLAPFGGRYTMGKGFGYAGKKGLWIPFLDTIGITLQFRSSNSVGRELFQCPKTTEILVANSAAGDGVAAHVLNRKACYLNAGCVPIVTMGDVGKSSCHVIYCQPDDSYKLPGQVQLPLPRWIEYSEDEQKTAEDTAWETRFSMVKLESSPHMFCLYASVQDNQAGRNAATGVSHQDEFFPLDGGAPYDERKPGTLTITSSSSGGLANSYSIKQLYELYRKNSKRLCPGRKCYDWETWKNSKCIVLLSPEDFGGLMPTQSLYKPQVFGLTCRFRVPAGYSTLVAQANGNRGRQEMNGAVFPRVRLCLLYMDNLVISAGAASVSSSMVSASAMSRSAAPVEEHGRALERMQVVNPGQ